MKPGVYYDLDFKVYNEQKEFLRSSHIKEGAKSMLHMKVAIGQRDVDKPEFHTGRLAHGLLFGQYTLNDLDIYAGKVRRGKTWDAVVEDHNGSTEMIVSEKQYNMLSMMVPAAKDHEVAADVFASIKPRNCEVSMFMDHHVYGKLKCRLDAYSDEHGIVEYKTTSTLNNRLFFNRAYDLGYHLQAGFYWWMMGLMLPEYEVDRVTFVVQETNPPYDCLVAKLPIFILSELAKKSLNIVEQYRQCERQKIYPGGYPKIMLYTFPSWSELSEFNVDGGNESWTI